MEPYQLLILIDWCSFPWYITRVEPLYIALRPCHMEALAQRSGAEQISACEPLHAPS
jgi:hypothetical protein